MERRKVPAQKDNSKAIYSSPDVARPSSVTLGFDDNDDMEMERQESTEVVQSSLQPQATTMSFAEMSQYTSEIWSSPTRSMVSEKKTGRRMKSAHTDMANNRAPSKLLPAEYFGSMWLSQRAYQIVSDEYFERFFYVVLAINALEMGFAISPTFDVEEYEALFFCLDLVFALLFTVEASLLLVVYGHRIIYNFWYTLQVFCTVGAIVDMFFRATGLGQEFKYTSKLMSSSRLLLLGQLFAVSKETSLIVTAMARSVKSLRGVLIVMLVICYGCTLAVYSIVGKKGAEYESAGVPFHEYWGHEDYFGDIPKTMLTLFSMLILSEWDSVVRPIYKVQTFFTLFFILFTLALTFGLLNVLVGIIVDTVNQIHQEHKQKLAKEKEENRKNDVDRIVEICFGDDDEIDFDEFLTKSENPEITRMLTSDFDVPHSFTFGELFCILDDDKDGFISKEELSDGLFSLLTGTSNSRIIALQLGISNAHNDVHELGRKVDTIGKLVADVALTQKKTSMQYETVVNIDDVLPDQSREQRVSGNGNGDLGEKCYSSLHRTVTKHCQVQLERAWEKTLSTDMSVYSEKTPMSTLSSLNDQENLIIWKKLQHAVSSESELALRKAVDHAIAAGIDSSLLALELTYKDALKHFRGKALPILEVREAIEKGDWSSSLDMIIESALANGADKQLLANIITKVSTDLGNFSTYTSSVISVGLGRAVPASPVSSFGTQYEELSSQPQSSPRSFSGRENSIKIAPEPSVQGRAGLVRKFPQLRTKEKKDQGRATNADIQGRLLSILHSEALNHCNQEKNQAWEALLNSGEGNRTGTKHVPLSQMEESFFVYNQLGFAVQQKSLLDLQRALSQASAAGLDIRGMDAEVAYRDALARCQEGTSYSVNLALDAFRRKEWYLALDILVQVSLIRGADRQSLLRALTKIYENSTTKA